MQPTFLSAGSNTIRTRTTSATRRKVLRDWRARSLGVSLIVSWSQTYVDVLRPILSRYDRACPRKTNKGRRRSIPDWRSIDTEARSDRSTVSLCSSACRQFKVPCSKFKVKPERFKLIQLLRPGNDLLLFAVKQYLKEGMGWPRWRDRTSG